MKNLLSFLLLIVPVFGYSGNPYKFKVQDLFMFERPMTLHTYYVSNAGSNSNNGLTPSTSWQTLVKVKSASADGTIIAGDSVLFNRGDLFICQDNFNGCEIWGPPTGSCASGTFGNPIVWSAYGTGAKPNFLFPHPASTDTTSRNVLSFEGVQYYVIDNLQINDSRSAVMKVTASWSLGIVFGERGSGQETYHCKIQNCDFNNTGNGVVIVGGYDSVVNCRVTNMGNVFATGGGSFGATDITMSGSHHYIVHNYLADGWAYSDAFSPFFNGGALEAFNTVDSCFIGYNTIVNCSGFIEFGATAGASTCRYDSFVYNKILNVGDLSYINVSGAFAIQPTELFFANNSIVENDSSLFSGPNGGRLMHNFPTWPSGYAAVFHGFYNNGSPTASVIYRLTNNLIRNYNSFTIIATPSKTVHTYNGYNFSGGTTVGTSLSTGEANVTNMWVDTSSSNLVQNWDFHLKQQIIGTVTGISPDFFGVSTLTAASQGIGNFGLPPNSIPIPFITIVNGVPVTIKHVQ